MAKEEPLVMEGVVEELLPGSTFLVRVKAGTMQTDMVVNAHLCGKMRKGHIRITVGDRVTLEMTPYDLTKARIKYRLK
jgi:translation initiation factor IF-1